MLVNIAKGNEEKLCLCLQAREEQERCGYTLYKFNDENFRNRELILFFFSPL